MFLYSILLVTAAYAICVTQATTCFYPDGNAATNGTPPLFVCDPFAQFSQCCTGSDMCTSNGLCKPGPDTNYYWRSSCTDRDFKSTACFPRCFNASSGANPNASHQNAYVEACSPTTYCCTTNGAPSSCCRDTSKVFDAGAASYLAGSNYVTQILSSTTSLSTSTSVAQTTASTAPAMSSPSAGAIATSSSIPTVESQQDSGLSTGVKAGIGVAVAFGALGLIAIGVLVGLLMRRRDKSKKQASSEKPHEEDSPQRQASELPAYTSGPKEASRRPAAPPAEADPSATVGQVPTEADSRAIRVELMGTELDPQGTQMSPAAEKRQ